MDSTSSFFFHKSSHRQLFQEEFARAQREKQFDIVFCNEREELTEGCISNIILYRNGHYVTPTVSSALLAGTMRKKLLADADSKLIEQTLFLQDLQQAEAIFCCNSVRGVVQVRFIGESI